MNRVLTIFRSIRSSTRDVRSCVMSIQIILLQRCVPSMREQAPYTMRPTSLEHITFKDYFRWYEMRRKHLKVLPSLKLVGHTRKITTYTNEELPFYRRRFSCLPTLDEQQQIINQAQKNLAPTTPQKFTIFGPITYPEPSVSTGLYNRRWSI